MAEIKKDATYYDEVERALYNTVLAGIAMDGKSFFYVNPLEVWPDACKDHTSRLHVKSERQKWFGVACCPPNIARTLASLSQYISFIDDKRLYINMFVSSEIEAELSGQTINVKIDSEVPWNGKVKLALTSTDEMSGNIALRIPYYAINPKISINGSVIAIVQKDGYAYIPLTGKAMDIELIFDMKAHFVHSNPRVRADVGKVAIMKGPIVYCLEQVDNGDNLASIFVSNKSPLTEEFDQNLLGGSTKITFKGTKLKEDNWDPNNLYDEKENEFEEIKLTAIPYCYWGNRKKNEEMTVWIKETFK
jgi:DUF1680 family protein